MKKIIAFSILAFSIYGASEANAMFAALLKNLGFRSEATQEEKQLKACQEKVEELNRTLSKESQKGHSLKNLIEESRIKNREALEILMLKKTAQRIMNIKFWRI